MALPVQELTDPEGCHLYLWTTNNFLPDALEVVKRERGARLGAYKSKICAAVPATAFRPGRAHTAWGFEHVTMITWLKDRQGLGQYYRGLTEHCIFARTKKGLPYKLLDGKRQQGVTGFYAPKGIHSAKPEEMRQMIEKVSYGPRIELFARENHHGWDVWGNEVESVPFAGGSFLRYFTNC